MQAKMIKSLWNIKLLLTIFFFWIATVVYCENYVSSCNSEIEEQMIVILPSEKHIKTVLFLHGFGNRDKATLFPTQLKRYVESFNDVKFILPLSNLYRKNGTKIGGWADLPLKKEMHQKEDEVRLRASSERISRILDCEIQSGVHPHNIIVGGFSQGGAVSYLTVMEYPKLLGGVFGLSCWLPLMGAAPRAVESWPNNPIQFSKAGMETPVLHCHGLQDTVILPGWGSFSVEHMRNMGVNVEAHLFKVGHTVIDEEIVEVARFIKRIFNKNPKPTA